MPVYHSQRGDFYAMHSDIQAQLLTLNRHFYTIVGADFDRTRQGLPSGMVQLAARLQRPGTAQRLLDAGCGNGRLARALAQAGVQGAYLGIDADAGLLQVAGEQARDLPGLAVEFRATDLATPGWQQAVSDRAPFDAVISLAVLHHFPGLALRQRLVADLASLLAPGGVLALSTWQFLAAERIADKVVPWSTLGLDPADVEPGDALLPWNQGAHALRYVHHLDLPEIEALAAATNLRIQDTWQADGKEGNLSLYVLLTPIP